MRDSHSGCGRPCDDWERRGRCEATVVMCRVWKACARSVWKGPVCAVWLCACSVVRLGEGGVGKLPRDTVEVEVEMGSTVRGVDVVRWRASSLFLDPFLRVLDELPQWMSFWLHQPQLADPEGHPCRPHRWNVRATSCSTVVPAEGPNSFVERNFVSSERLLLCAMLALASPVAVRSGGVRCAVVWCVVVLVCVCVCLGGIVCACVWGMCVGGVCGWVVCVDGWCVCG